MQGRPCLRPGARVQEGPSSVAIAGHWTGHSEALLGSGSNPCSGGSDWSTPLVCPPMPACACLCLCVPAYVCPSVPVCARLYLCARLCLCAHRVSGCCPLALRDSLTGPSHCEPLLTRARKQAGARPHCVASRGSFPPRGLCGRAGLARRDKYAAAAQGEQGPAGRRPRLCPELVALLSDTLTEWVTPSPQ